MNLFDPAITKPLPLKNRKGFNFLTIMKWEKRKGWDLLLSAYFQEFSATDDVALYIVSHLDENAQKEYKKFLNETMVKVQSTVRPI